MGEQDMSTHDGFSTPTTEAIDTQIFTSYTHHLSAPRTSTDLHILTLLRASHPSHHITLCTSSSCDLLGYATAGHATATPLKGPSSNLYDAITSYQSPGPRMFFAGKPGLLVDSVRFGKYEYVWGERSFLVYQVEYTEPFKAPTKNFYVLHEREIEGGGKGEEVIRELLLAVGDWSTVLHKEIYVFDDGRWSKNRELWKSVQGASWDEVILNPVMKANLIEDVQGFFDNRELYKSLAVPWKRGIIMHGVPGNGKTISIKALINALEGREEPVPSLYVKNFDACNGQKASIRQIFTHARIMAPCLLIFEDLDSLVTDKTRSYFLNEVDGLDSNDGILMIGSTNHLDSLDPAISKRPSRFDRKYHFKIPNEDERVAYCEFWRKKLVVSKLVDFDERLSSVIAKLSEGFSFAYMKELFIIALLTIARGTHVDVEEGDDAKSEAGTEPVMVEHEQEPAAETNQAANLAAVAANTSAGETVPKAEAKQEEAPKKKRILPVVDIPEDLKENVLLKVIKSQLQILIDEMDNTKEEEWQSFDKPKGGVVTMRHIYVDGKMRMVPAS